MVKDTACPDKYPVTKLITNILIANKLLAKLGWGSNLQSQMVWGLVIVEISIRRLNIT